MVVGAIAVTVSLMMFGRGFLVARHGLLVGSRSLADRVARRPPIANHPVVLPSGPEAYAVALMAAAVATTGLVAVVRYRARRQLALAVGLVALIPVLLVAGTYVDYITAHGGYLVAVDLRTGGIRWRLQGSDRDPVPMRAADGLVLVDSGTDAGAIVALDAANGRERWRVVRGRLWSVNDTGGEGPLIVTAGGAIAGLDAATGRRLWTAGFASTGAILDVAVSSTTVAVLSRDRCQHAPYPASPCVASLLAVFDRETGQRRWTTELSPSVLRVVADDASIVAAAPASLMALDASNGQVRWKREHGYDNGLSLRGGVLLQAGARDLTALDAVTGAARWHWSTDTRGLTSGVALLDTSATAVVVRDNTTVRVLDLATGREAFQLDGVAVARLTGTSMVVLDDRRGTVAMYDVASHGKRSEASVGAAELVPFATVSDDTAYLVVPGRTRPALE